MDDQTPYPSDPAVTQVPRKRKPSRRSQSGQPSPAREETPLVPASQPLLSTEADRSTRQLPSPQPNATRQLSTPQPIRFPEVEIDIVAGVQQTLGLRRQRLRRTRRWLRSRTGRVIVPLLALVIGLAVGLGSILWYGLSGVGSIGIIVKSAQGNLIIEADKDFVTQLVRDDIANAGLPGQVKNVTVTLARGDGLVIQGDDVYSLLGLSLSRHFVLSVQPYVKSCVLQIRVTNANLGGIPVTNFVQSFEGNINQQLAKKPAGLPSGFTYCTVGVRTDVGGMFITYKAVAVSK